MSKPKPTHMRLRVVHKLFLLLALVIVLALGTLGGMTVINLQRGFVAYVNTLDLARLTPLVDELDARADATHGFVGLRDRAAWDALLHQTLEPKPPVGAAGRRPPPPPPPPRDSGAPPPLKLPPRVSLLDGQHRTIAGTPPPEDALQRPLVHDGVVIGWLALRPLTKPADNRDTAFLSAQVQQLVWLAALLVLFALLAAWIFARHLLGPLRAVEEAAEQLVSGDYEVHLDTVRRDELGDLVRHIKRLGAALQTHRTARQRWFADISHELRTPLSIVRGEVEAMQDGLRKADADALASLHEEVMRLDRLVADLHQLSMADLGTLSYQMQVIDMADLVDQVCSRFAATMRESELTIEKTLVSARVRADPDRMRQLLDNLLDNSLRYTQRGGRIVAEMTVVDGSVHVCIADSPPGVSAEAMSRLFEPLYRGESSRNRQSGGSGLGLAIAKRIAIAHEGELQA
ncbi:MAG: ATP-binding protein, partial [Rhodanobacter sp.]